MKRVLGIEGGGTKTEWLYVDEADSQPQSGTLPAANLRLVANEALERMFRLLPSDPTHVGVYLAGCANDADRNRLYALASKLWPGAKISVGSDRESGFATAFGDEDGIAIIAGTGSAITGRKDGRTEKAGGWGQLLGDKGSGYDLAMQALRHVLWHYDLTHKVIQPGEEILARLALNRLDDLVNWAKNADKMSVAKLAPVVFKAAGDGDKEMAAIVDAGAKCLAEGVGAVARRLRLEAPLVKLQGGLFVGHPRYVERVTSHLLRILPEAQLSVCTESGATGAVWLAAREVFKISVSEPEVDLGELAGALTEQANARSSGLDQMSTPEIVDLFITEESKVQDALYDARSGLIAAIEITSDALRNGGRLFYVGAGTSGRLGTLDASEIPPTFGAGPELVQAIMAGGVTALYQAVEGAEDEFHVGCLSVIERGVKAGDVVCGITASGRTPFVLGALRTARDLSARTILLACNPARTKTGNSWDVEIDLATGPELLAGSTRLKAGTATKCALNILSTATMVRLGKVRGNLMTSVLVTNVKLRDRAIRLVSSLRGLSREEAESLLEGHNWDVARCVGG